MIQSIEEILERLDKLEKKVDSFIAVKAGQKEAKPVETKKPARGNAKKKR